MNAELRHYLGLLVRRSRSFSRCLRAWSAPLSSLYMLGTDDNYIANAIRDTPLTSLIFLSLILTTPNRKKVCRFTDKGVTIVEILSSFRKLYAKISDYLHFVR